MLYLRRGPCYSTMSRAWCPCSGERSYVFGAGWCPSRYTCSTRPQNLLDALGQRTALRVSHHRHLSVHVVLKPAAVPSRRTSYDPWPGAALKSPVTITALFFLRSFSMVLSSTLAPVMHVTFMNV